MFDTVKDPKYAWQILNALLQRTGLKSPDALTVDGITVSGSALADKFNDFFVSLIDTVHDSSALQCLSNRIDSSMFMQPCDDGEIVSIFRNLRLSKSADLLGLKLQPVLHVIDLAALILSHIFNLSLTSGTFPSELKKSKLVVLYKSGAKNDLGNYRPISILPVFSKGLERLIFFKVIRLF